MDSHPSRFSSSQVSVPSSINPQNADSHISDSNVQISHKFDSEFLQTLAGSLYDIFRREMIVQGKKPADEALLSPMTSQRVCQPTTFDTQFPMATPLFPTSSHRDSQFPTASQRDSQIPVAAQRDSQRASQFPATAQRGSQFPSTTQRDSFDSQFPSLPQSHEFESQFPPSPQSTISSPMISSNPQNSQNDSDVMFPPFPQSTPLPPAISSDNVSGFVAGNSLPRSFARVLDAASELQQDICKPINKGAFYSVFVDEDVYNRGIAELRNSIIGRVISVKNEKPLSNEALKQKLSSLWKILDASWKLIPLGFGRTCC